MPNKTPSYKDKVIEDFSNHFGLNGLHAKPLEYMDYEPVIDEVKDFISQALEEQMKEVVKAIEAGGGDWEDTANCLKIEFEKRGLI